MKVKKTSLENSGFSKDTILGWPIWTCSISEFDWVYKEKESCYLLEGEVILSSTYETIKFRAGDFLVFPRGLRCTWRVLKPVKKHYIFQ